MLERFLPRESFDSYEDFKANYQVNVPENFNFAYDVIDAWAAEEPDRTAMVWCNDSGDEKTFSFGDLARLSDQAANLFAAQGMGKGDVVMLMLKRRWQYWVATLALQKLGAISVPATAQLTRKDVAFRCRAAGVAMIVAVADDEVARAVEEALAEAPTVRARALVGGRREGWLNFDALLAAAPAGWRRPTGAAAAGGLDPMIMYFTSGTTSMPKIALQDFTHPLGHIVTARYWQRLDGTGLHLTVSESGWAKCGWGKLYGQWLTGTAIFVHDMERFNADALLKNIGRYRVTSFCAPPTIYRFFIKEDLSKYDFSSVRTALTAGEPLNPEVFQQFRKATGLEILEGFGQSETTVLCAIFPGIEPRPGSMGKPAPLYDIDIVDEQGQSCPAGVEGSIVIKSLDEGLPPGLFRGYHGDEEGTRRVWKDGVYNTGDVAWRDEEGYYWFVGRSDDVIKCSGYRIGPFEVESALLEHPSVLECAVTAAPDPVRGQVVKATVVLAPGRGYVPGPELVRELQEHVKRVTAPYKYPRIVEFVPELPKTISGKIRRVQIRQQDEAIPASEVSPRPPVTAPEATQTVAAPRYHAIG